MRGARRLGRVAGFGSSRNRNTIVLLVSMWMIPVWGLWAEADSAGVHVAMEVSAEEPCASEVPVTMVVTSFDHRAIDLVGVRIGERVQVDATLAPAEPVVPAEPGDPKVAPRTTGDGPAPLQSGLREAGRAVEQRGVEPGLEVRVPLTLVPPVEDGHYFDMAFLQWRYAAGASAPTEAEGSMAATLAYRFADGCVQSMTLDDLYARADPITQVGVFQGGTTTQLAIAQGPPGTTGGGGSSGSSPSPLDDLDLPVFDDDPPLPGLQGEVLDLRVCFRVRYRDAFDGCPNNVTGMRWWRPYCDGRLVPVQGLEVTLFDRDSSSNDDHIGTWALHYNGLNDVSCIDFQWDQGTRNETFPDVWIMTRFDVVDTDHPGNRHEIHLCRTEDLGRAECGDKFAFGWRDAFIADVRPTPTPVRNYDFGGGSGVWNRRAMQVAAGQKALRSFRGERMTSDMNIWWNSDTCKLRGRLWPCSVNDRWFTMPSWRFQDIYTVPHEYGHSYQKQLFEQDHLTGKRCPRPHFLDQPHNEACATREGWANFVAAMAWFPDPAVFSGGRPVYRNVGVDVGGPVHNNCPDDAKTQLQVTRTFWDLYDGAGDGFDLPGVQRSRSDIVRTWDDFPDGRGNRNDRERGSNGVNLEDFLFHAAWDADMESDTDAAMLENVTNCQSSG